MSFITKIYHFFFLSFCLFLFACGPSSDVQPEEKDNIIVITNQMFVPHTVTVGAGEVVFFNNQDNTTHQILSQSEEDAFDDTGVFSSNIIPHNSVVSITIPDDVLEGDILYFYDGYFEEAMHTPSGSITIE